MSKTAKNIVVFLIVICLLFTVAWINGRDTVSRDITLYAKWVKET